MQSIMTESPYATRIKMFHLHNYARARTHTHSLQEINGVSDIQSFNLLASRWHPWHFPSICFRQMANIMQYGRRWVVRPINVGHWNFRSAIFQNGCGTSGRWRCLNVFIKHLWLSWTYVLYNSIKYRLE